VFDKAGNQAMASVMFTMVELPAPPVALEITDAHAYPNPADADTGTRFSVSLSGSANVSVRIYDFAGREVRSLDYAGKTNGKSKIEIVFDARNNDGVKLARGSYFARVIANDGMKTVEKIVKIAIRK
jgi:flagellar hook assembly protein FlgD